MKKNHLSQFNTEENISKKVIMNKFSKKQEIC